MGKNGSALPKMNRNIVAAAILAVIIVVTVIGLESRQSSPVDRLFGQLQLQLNSEQWAAAGITTGALHTEWQSRKIWLSLNGSRNAIQDFDRQLARLQAAVKLQDKSLASATATELIQMWSNFAG